MCSNFDKFGTYADYTMLNRMVRLFLLNLLTTVIVWPICQVEKWKWSSFDEVKYNHWV